MPEMNRGRKGSSLTLKTCRNFENLQPGLVSRPVSQQRTVVKVTGYQLSKPIHEKEIIRTDGNRGEGRADTQQGRGCQRMPLPMDLGEGRGRPVLQVEEAAKIHLSFDSHADGFRKQIKTAFQQRREDMQTHGLLIYPAMEVRPRIFP